MATLSSSATRKPPARHRPTYSRAARHLAAFRKQPAQMCDADARQICEKALAYDASRALLLASLTKSGAELIAATKAAADVGCEAVARAALQPEEYAQRPREMADLMDTVNLRLPLALCEPKDADRPMKVPRS
jgi:hypothetical protein